MKCSVLISTLFLSLTSTCVEARRDIDRLVSAIEEIDLVLVKKLLKREGFSDEKQKKELVGIAEDIVEECEKNVSLLRSKQDFALCACGIACAAFGIFSPILKYKKNLAKILSKEADRLLRFCLIATGVYISLKSLSCPAASRVLEDAQDIEDMLRNACVLSKHTCES